MCNNMLQILHVALHVGCEVKEKRGLHLRGILSAPLTGWFGLGATIKLQSVLAVKKFLFLDFVRWLPQSLVSYAISSLFVWWCTYSITRLSVYCISYLSIRVMIIYISPHGQLALGRPAPLHAFYHDQDQLHPHCMCSTGCNWMRDWSLNELSRPIPSTVPQSHFFFER
jgi:hypothetical protein